MKRYLLQQSISYINLINADLNGDGKINSSDYTLLKRYLLGYIDSFPVENQYPTTPEPSPTPTPAVDEEAWKNNTGTIELGDTIKVSGEGISVNGFGRYHYSRRRPLSYRYFKQRHDFCQYNRKG